MHRKPGPRQFALALLATALWMGTGVYKRVQTGQDVLTALWAELPLGVVIFVVSLLWASRLRR
ncbi:hypothetical protein [Deinococcus hohokamensis]|uniref:EamA family transporter n=1 Tax=Deinococcus hohokamensis TaxID=309883 RepID=A0ABV9IB50_9DEIO